MTKALTGRASRTEHVPAARAAVPLLAGLAGVWGEIVREWLDDLLPPDAAQRASGRVTIVVLRTLPYPRRLRFSEFSSRHDLIDCALASCHIPYFLDGHFTARFRRQRWIDGSFLASKKRGLRMDDGTPPLLLLDPAADPGAPRDFLRLRTPEAVRAILESGIAYSRSPQVRVQAAQLAAARPWRWSDAARPDHGLLGCEASSRLNE